MPQKYYSPKKKSSKSSSKSSSSFKSKIWRLLKRPFKILYRLLVGERTGWAVAKLFITLALILSVSGFLGIAGVIGYFSRDLPDPGKLIDRQVAQSTKILDRTGETLLYEIAGDERRTLIKLEELPPYAAQAVIALEDKTFYEHKGFNYRRLAYAIGSNLLGGKGPGASTLTSQLVKNAILTPERRVTRKIKEWILTFQIERKFSKEEILQLYLNEIPYGANVYGIEAASNYYFDKSARDISLEEAAVLAAIINRPSYLSPYKSNVQELLDRKDLALFLMKEQGFITEDEMNAAQESELVFRERVDNITAPHFVFYVEEQLIEKYGEHMVNQGGLTVRTTLDLDKHQLAEEVMKERAEANLEYNASNASIVSIDPKTGEILVMIGSVDYFNDEIDGQFNVATSPRQPGSSFKPFVYTQAWRRGYTPSSVLFDVVTKFPGNGKAYEPKNYDLNERGPISLRKSLQGSLNITAVKLLYLVGVDPVIQLAADMGYTTLTDPDRYGLSLVLGGGEVKLLEHTAAYATLAAEGEYREPMAILEVQTTSGETLDEFTSEPRQALEKNIARMTTNVLSDNDARSFAFGAANNLTLPGRQVAAKTGTTNDYRDAWTMGYTPNLATGVWVGNNDFSEMNRGAGGSTVAAPIWNSFMRQALQEMDVEGFTSPNIEQPEKAILSGKGFGVQQVTIDKASEKLATNLTPESYRVEKLFIDAHTILYYVDKRNPLGPIPEQSNDPQFNTWEAAVQEWINRKIEANEPIFDNVEDQGLPEDLEIVFGLPPTEEDDMHIAANQPSLELKEPRSNEELSSRRLNARVTARAPRGISRVEFYMDDILVATDSSVPFETNASLKAFPNGFYFLKVIAYDDIDNSVEEVIRVKLQSEEPAANLSWVSPESGRIVKPTDFPLQLDFNAEADGKLSQITFFSKNENGQDELIEAIVSPAQGLLQALWDTAPPPGNYEIFTKVSFEGEVLTGPKILITVEEDLPDGEKEEETTE